jgi:hypothetical protein
MPRRLPSPWSIECAASFLYLTERLEQGGAHARVDHPTSRVGNRWICG